MSSPAIQSWLAGTYWAARISARQFLTGPRKWIILLLGAIYPALMAVFVYLQKRGLVHPYLQLFDELYLQGLLLFLALFGSTSAFASDVEDGTVVYLFSRPIPRALIVLGKWVGMMVPLLVLSLIPVFGAWPFALAQRQDYTVTVRETLEKPVARSGSGENASPTEEPTVVRRQVTMPSERMEARPRHLLMACTATVLGIFMYGTLFYCMGVIFRWPFVFSLIYAVLFEIIIGRADFRFHVMTKLIRSATIRMIDPTPRFWEAFLTETAPSPLVTAIGLTAVPILSMALAGLVAMHKAYVTKGI